MDTNKLRPLLIFSAEYDDDTLNREGVTNTANELKAAMFSKHGLGFNKSQVEVLENVGYTYACDQIIDFLGTIKPDEIPLIIYCGHGFPDFIEKDVYISFKDTNMRNYNTCGYSSKSLVKEIKKHSIENVIVIFDCCHSGYLTEMSNLYTVKDFDGFDDISGAIYLSTVRGTDICNQIKINGIYHLPFSYYLALALSGKLMANEKFLSINRIKETIELELSKLSDPYKCRIKSNGDIGDKKIFHIHGDELNNSPFTFERLKDMVELKLLLVKTMIEHPIKNNDFGIPLGLYALKDYMKFSGFKLVVDIYDERLELIKCNAKRDRQSIIENFANTIKDYDVIGVSISTSEVFPAFKKFKIAKELGKITICGGIFSTSNEDYLLNSNLIDYVIPGMAGEPLLKLLSYLYIEKKHKALHKHVLYSDYGIIRKGYVGEINEPWKTYQLPCMSTQTLDLILKTYGKYINGKMDVYSARGCDKNCLFCSVQRESRQTVIRKKDSKVIEEIVYLKQAGIAEFSFKDENLLSDEKRLIYILDNVSGEGIKFKIRARFDELKNSRITLKRLNEYGVSEIQYGIESPDILLSSYIDKGVDKATNDSLVNFIREHNEHGITANCSFILGIQGENDQYYNRLKSFIKTIYNDESKPKIYINFITPHPFNSQFSLIPQYQLITKNLNYFTHKYPVCYPVGMTRRGTREKLLDTYNEIVEYTKSKLYNPIIDKNSELSKWFLQGRNESGENLIYPKEV